MEAVLGELAAAGQALAFCGPGEATDALADMPLIHIIVLLGALFGGLAFVVARRYAGAAAVLALAAVLIFVV